MILSEIKGDYKIQIESIQFKTLTMSFKFGNNPAASFDFRFKTFGDFLDFIGSYDEQNIYTISGSVNTEFLDRHFYSTVKIEDLELKVAVNV